MGVWARVEAGSAHLELIAGDGRVVVVPLNGRTRTDKDQPRQRAEREQRRGHRVGQSDEELQRRESNSSTGEKAGTGRPHGCVSSSPTATVGKSPSMVIETM